MEIKYLKQYRNQPRHLFTLNILRNATSILHWSDIPLVSLACEHDVKSMVGIGQDHNGADKVR